MLSRAASSVLANLVNSNVVRAVRRRGNLNNGANYGPCYVNANNAPSNSNWNYGGRQFPTSYFVCVVSLHTVFPWFRKELKYHPTGSAW